MTIRTLSWAIGLTVIVTGSGLGAGGDPPAPGGAPNGQGEAPPQGQDGDPADFWADDGRDFAEVLKRSIASGRRWLLHRQDAEGSWGSLTGGTKRSLEDSPTGSGPLRVRPSPSGNDRKPGAPYAFEPGLDALVLYTLLRTGTAPTSPAVRKAFQRIRDKKLELPASSPASAMLLLAVCSTAIETQGSGPSPPRRVVFATEFRTWCQQLVDHLVRKQQALGWRYNARDLEPLPGGHDDLASTTLVAFALLAAHGRGVKVGAEVWERLLDFTLQLQDESGPEVRRPVLSGATNGLAPPVDHARGFAYSRILPDANEGRPSMGMTCCGVANLLMARYVLTETPVLKKRWDAGRLGKTTQVALDDGLAWLSLHWEPVPKAYLHYSHWMLEMCMGLAGRRLVGAHVWWDEIARSVVNRQAKDGDWESGTNHFDPSALDTCLALLVLSRSTKTELAMAGLENLRPAAR